VMERVFVQEWEFLCSGGYVCKATPLPPGLLESSR
jgi:hypothetical protein